MASWSKASTSSQSSTTSQKHTDSLCTTSKALNEQLLETILLSEKTSE